MIDRKTDVIPAPIASEASERNKAGTQAPRHLLLRGSGRDHAGGEAVAELCMGPGLVPRAPFGHSRRRDDEEETHPSVSL